MKKRLISCGHNDLRSYPEIESLLQMRITRESKNEQVETKSK